MLTNMAKKVLKKVKALAAKKDAKDPVIKKSELDPIAKKKEQAVTTKKGITENFEAALKRRRPIKPEKKDPKIKKDKKTEKKITKNPKIKYYGNRPTT